MFSVRCHKTRCLEKGEENAALPKLERAPALSPCTYFASVLVPSEGNRDAFDGTSAPKESVHSWDIDSTSHSLRLPSPYVAGANAEWHSPWENSRHMIRKLNTHALHLTKWLSYHAPIK